MLHASICIIFNDKTGLWTNKCRKQINVFTVANSQLQKEDSTNKER